MFELKIEDVPEINELTKQIIKGCTADPPRQVPVQQLIAALLVVALSSLRTNFDLASSKQIIEKILSDLV